MTVWLDDVPLPSRFDGPDELDDFLTRPSKALAADLAAIDGDIMVLGVGGKMGPTLARLARNAAPDKRVIGVARFSEAGLRGKLNAYGVDDHRLRSARPRRGAETAAGPQRRLHGRA